MSIYNKDDIIQYHVQVWRPLIIKLVDGKTLASYMCPDFITSEQKIQIREKPLKSESTEFLLEILEENTERGKWTSFLQALKENNYQHLLSVLKGDADRENKQIELQRRLIEIFAAEIEKEVDANIIARYLLPSRALQYIDIEMIQSAQELYGRTFGVWKLLELLPTRVTEWFDIFLEVLYNNGHKDLVLHIDDTYEKKHKLEKEALGVQCQSREGKKIKKIDEDVLEETYNEKESDIHNLSWEETFSKQQCRERDNEAYLKQKYREDNNQTDKEKQSSEETFEKRPEPKSQCAAPQTEITYFGLSSFKKNSVNHS